MANSKSDIEVKKFSDHHVITQPNPLRKVLRRVADDDIDDPVARAEKALSGLSGEFRQWMEIEVGRLAAAHAAILKSGFTKTARDELFRAESLCRIIEHAPDLARVPPDLIVHHINAIQAIVHEHTKLDTISMSNELSRRLRGVADEYLARVNRDRPEHLEVIMAPNIAPAD